MEIVRHKTARPGPSAWIRHLFAANLSRVCLVCALFCVARPGQAAESYGALVDQHFAAGTTNAAPAPVATAGPTPPDLAALEKALKVRAEKISAPTPPPPPPAINPTVRVAFPWVMAALVLAAFTLVGIKIRSHRIAAAEAREAEKLERLGEDPTVVALLEELQHGLSAAPVEVVPEVHNVISEAENQKLRNQAVSAEDAAFLFFEIIPHEFKRLRERFSIITGFSDQTARLQMLAEMAAEIRPTKTVPQLPALRSYRLLALALEGLLKQLSCKAGNITDWRLQLASSSIGLLEDLCAPNLGPDLATKPPIRLLVVDDCAISRRSMSMALKKVFPQPDLADGGEPALELTAQHVYDVIFLDIEMPGMDGFELCSRIRETSLNRHTPIVFVTSHDNLESRAKLVTRGAQDLIGKPYLPTEINLKALQLSLQGRLQNGVSAAAVGATVDGAPLPAEPLSLGALTSAPSAG